MTLFCRFLFTTLRRIYHHVIRFIQIFLATKHVLVPQSTIPPHITSRPDLARGSFHRFHRVIEQLGLPMLKQRRNEAKVIMMYKILNNSVLIDHNLEYNTNHTRGHSFKLVTLPTRINTYYDSFFHSTVTLWNDLPVGVVTSSNLEHFRKSCNSYLYN